MNVTSGGPEIFWVLDMCFLCGVCPPFT